MFQSEEFGSDADHLVFEGMRGGKYHVVNRYDPEPTYEELCHFVLGLTGIEMQDSWEAYHGSAEPTATPE